LARNRPTRSGSPFPSLTLPLPGKEAEVSKDKQKREEERRDYVERRVRLGDDPRAAERAWDMGLGVALPDPRPRVPKPIVPRPR
jgi:hypothetical protein